MPSTHTVEVKTVQASAIKVLVEALKELLTDTVIDFDENGIKIIAMDTTHTVLVHLKLDASKFEYYTCSKKVSIGVNMMNLHKLIKTINSNDILTLFVEQNDINHLGIKIENGDKNTKTTYKLDLLDLDNNKIFIQPAEFNSVITLPSSDFQKICRDMHNLAEYIEIKNIGSQIMFTCNGDFCNQETIISDSDSVKFNGVQEPSENIVQGVYNLKYLVLFTKCTNLCNTVDLYLKNDYPLIVKYDVASLGEIKLCLAPQQQTVQ
jgi:proliferating cell nuclear antigen